VKPDTTFILLDADFMALYEGTLKAPKAWMSGRLKIKGNKYAALSFKPDVIMAEIGEDIDDLIAAAEEKKPNTKFLEDRRKRQSTKTKMDKMKELLENGEEERRKTSLKTVKRESFKFD